MKVSERIAKARRIAGIGQQELGEIIGYSKMMISHWETGKRRPNEFAMGRLCAVLSIPPKDMAASIREEEAEKGKDLGMKKAEAFMNFIKD
jgi:transcriptional regulator with XRE-family HTH domain